jgi:hypothetical protein
MEPEKEQCAICMDDLDKLRTARVDCKHTFHKMCIKQLVDKSEQPTCPLCREYIDTLTDLPYEPPEERVYKKYKSQIVAGDLGKNNIKMVPEFKELTPEQQAALKKMIEETTVDVDIGGRRTRRYKRTRKMTRKYCKKTSCRKMGFTQKASCRPYKNCYRKKK